MSTVLTIANLAGGTTKTTTAHNLAVAFSEYGKKVLLIDLDAKGDLTFTLGAEAARFTIADLLTMNASSDSAVISSQERFDFIPGSSHVNNVSDKEKFASLLKKFSEKYDVIILDTPSTPSAGLVMALEVADSVLYPICLTTAAFRGAHRIHSLVGSHFTEMAFLKTDGFRNSRLEKEIAQTFDLLDCEISSSEEIRESTNTILSVLSTSKNSVIASSYRELAYSVLENFSLI